MGKREIYECDKCSLRVESPELPTEWTSAICKTPGASYGSTKSYLTWCYPCWNKVIRPTIVEAASGHK